MNNLFAKSVMRQKRIQEEAANTVQLTDTERIDALEDAVMALSSSAPEEATAQMTKLYNNMVKLDKIDSADVPSNLQADVEGVLQPKEKANDSREEAVQ